MGYNTTCGHLIAAAGGPLKHRVRCLRSYRRLLESVLAEDPDSLLCAIRDHTVLSAADLGQSHLQ